MVTFNFTYQPGITLQQMIGFEIAGRLWSTYFTDPVTVNIHVGTSNLDQSVLAGALSGYKTAIPYTGYETNGLRSYIQNDAKSQDDSTAYNSSITTSMNGGAFIIYDASGQALGARIANGTSVSIPRANAKALNVPLDNAAGLDGYIIVNQTVKNTAGQVVPWGYNYSSATVASNTIDFVSVAAHEIGHVLGFVSGVDRPWKFTVAGSSSLSYEESRSLLEERINESTPLDLFRTLDISNVASSVTRERSIGGSPFLSLSNGNTSTALGYFATGKDKTQGGNGFQASHWLGQGTSSGLMNATVGTGIRASFANLDLRTFDVIGWDRSTATTSTSLSWSTLLSQAKQALANRISKTTTWLDSNTTTATSLLSQDRLTDVDAMADANPNIYEGRANHPGGSWQELFSLLSEQGLYDSLATDQTSKPPQATQDSDVLAGSTEDDVLAGHQGHDQLIGFTGDDRLAGNRGQDVLLGNLGCDRISGGVGDDLLVGGRGGDRLIGGQGKDIFVIQNRFGMDEVADFTNGQDQLLLDQGLQFGQLTITQQGNDTLIRLEQTPLMLLHGVSADQITIADFA